MKITLTVEEGETKMTTSFTKEELETFYESHSQSLLDVTCMVYIDEIQKQRKGKNHE